MTVLHLRGTYRMPLACPLASAWATVRGMAEGALSWPEVYGRTQAVAFDTAAGRVRYRLPAGDSISEGELWFWHQAPDRWRVADEHGVLHIHDGQRQLVRSNGQMEDMSAATINFRPAHPQTLFGVRREGGVEFEWLRDFPNPSGLGESVEVAGHSAWEFALTAVEHKRSRKPYRLRVAIDKATGAVLRVAVPDADYVIAMTGFTPDAELSDSVFGWDGPVSTRHRDERAQQSATRQWLEHTDLPRPHWWPQGLGYDGLDGDPNTGSFHLMLEVPGFRNCAAGRSASPCLQAGSNASPTGTYAAGRTRTGIGRSPSMNRCQTTTWRGLSTPFRPTDQSEGCHRPAVGMPTWAKPGIRTQCTLRCLLRRLNLVVRVDHLSGPVEARWGAASWKLAVKTLSPFYR